MPVKKFYLQRLFLKLFFVFFLLASLTSAIAQTTSWKGSTSTSWTTATNWTNGVPTASVDAIIGDANFTTNNQPTISQTASCKSLTIGGTKAATLTVNYGLTINSNLIINTNGTLN